MFDIDNNTEPNLQRLINLYSFLVVFLFQEELEKTSPDYLIEKWNYWIGEDVKLKQNTLYPSDIVKFSNYCKNWNWNLNTDKILSVKEIFYFTFCIEELDLKNFVYWFKYFGGDLMKISSEKKTGLHPLAHKKVIALIQNEENAIKAFIREMKITELENET